MVSLEFSESNEWTDDAHGALQPLLKFSLCLSSTKLPILLMATHSFDLFALPLSCQYSSWLRIRSTCSSEYGIYV